LAAASTRVELFSEVGSWAMAGSKGARKSGAASAARGARSNGASMERMLGVCGGFNCYRDACALALRNVVGVAPDRGGGNGWSWWDLKTEGR
jgi:hypothetical protein